MRTVLTHDDPRRQGSRFSKEIPQPLGQQRYSILEYIYIYIFRRLLKDEEINDFKWLLGCISSVVIGSSIVLRDGLLSPQESSQLNRYLSILLLLPPLWVGIIFSFVEV